MKILLIFKCAVLIFFSFSLSNCNNNSTPKELSLTDDFTEVAFKDCSEACKILTGKRFGITKECAYCMMDNYEANGYKFFIPNDSGSEKIRGFSLQPVEIQEIAQRISKDSTAHVFSMMGIYHGQDSETETSEIVTTPELVLIVKYNSLEAETEEMEYYNFTQPCPNFCPEN